MLPNTVLDRFIEQCPPAVMVRATLENLLPPERLAQIFSDDAERQCEKRFLFSQVVAVMSAAATRTDASVHASYLAHCDGLGVSVSAVYDKLKCVEPCITAAMVRETAADAARVVDAMPGARKSVLPGFDVFFFDGNHLAATEHRVAELCATREGPLPGQTLALLDARPQETTASKEERQSQSSHLHSENPGCLKKKPTLKVASDAFYTSEHSPACQIFPKCGLARLREARENLVQSISLFGDELIMRIVRPVHAVLTFSKHFHPSVIDQPDVARPRTHGSRNSGRLKPVSCTRPIQTFH